jgi:uncharacterized RDD family membrane protein YckC
MWYLYLVEWVLRHDGQTVGRRVMKIAVVPLDPQSRMTRGRYAKRWLVQVPLASLVPFFSYLNGLWQLWDKPYRQCLHDKWPQTVVVKIGG